MTASKLWQVGALLLIPNPGPSYPECWSSSTASSSRCWWGGSGPSSCRCSPVAGCYSSWVDTPGSPENDVFNKIFSRLTRKQLITLISPFVECSIVRWSAIWVLIAKGVQSQFVKICDINNLEYETLSPSSRASKGGGPNFPCCCMGGKTRSKNENYFFVQS